jgi:hypothetical protein
MDELISFILIWVVLYVVNLLSKKLKQKEPPAQKTSPVTGKPEVPTATETVPPKKEWDLKELFEELTGERPERRQRPVDADDTYQSRRYESETELLEEKAEEEQIPDQEELFEKQKDYSEEEELAVTKDSPILEKEPPTTGLKEVHLKVADQKRKPKVNRNKLKQAIAWKEILDKPLSLRFPLTSRNRVS